jgi:Protein of unknown function (DUF3016)
MRKFLYLLLVPMVSLGLPNVHALEPSNVRINFVRPKYFTDFRIQDRDENASVPIFRDEISSYLSPIVAKRFPGKTLTLTFTDIDLAGRLGNRPGVNQIRFNRELGPSPIRLSFNYAITDSKGSVVAGGSRALLAQAYLTESDWLYYPQSLKTSTLFYEQATLAKWVRELEPSSSKLARE